MTKAQRPTVGSSTSSDIQCWICQKCKVLIHKVEGPLGEKVWAHGRAWEKHDHEPDPVRVDASRAVLSCDYCGGYGPKWLHFGSDVAIGLVGGGTEPWSEGLGDKWAACPECDKLVMQALREGSSPSRITPSLRQLVDRHMQFGCDNGLYEVDNAFQLEYARKTFAIYVPSIHRRMPLPPAPPPPPALTPRLMPRVREKLINFWQGEMWFTALTSELPVEEEPILIPGADWAGAATMGVPTKRCPEGIAQRFIDRVVTGLHVGEMYWVSSEFTMLALNAGKKLPDLTLVEEEMPSSSGLILFAQPIRELRRGDRSAEIIGMSWVRVPGGVWLTLYGRADNGTMLISDAAPEYARQVVGYIMPLAPGAPLRFGKHTPRENDNDTARTIWATLIATFHLMQQPGVGEITVQQADRKDRQRAGRAGLRTPEVRVVDLRRRKVKGTPQHSGEPKDWGREHWFTVRSLVGGDTGGFWRDQPYGPQRSLRKRVWIEPFLRGPADAPLKLHDTPTVKVLR